MFNSIATQRKMEMHNNPAIVKYKFILTSLENNKTIFIYNISPAYKIILFIVLEEM